jgi:hypothetical protein
MPRQLHGMRAGRQGQDVAVCSGVPRGGGVEGVEPEDTETLSVLTRGVLAKDRRIVALRRVEAENARSEMIDVRSKLHGERRSGGTQTSGES